MFYLLIVSSIKYNHIIILIYLSYRIYSTNDPRWQKTSELHVLEVIMSLARYYLQNVDLWPSGMQR